MFLRILFVAVIVSLVAGFAPLGHAGERPTFDVPRLENVTIDGEAGDWGTDLGLRIDQLVPLEGRLKSVEDHDARFRIGWDTDGLLLLIICTDDTWVEHPSNEQLWWGDAVEMFLAAEPGAPDVGQWVISPGMSGSRSELRWFFHENRKDEKLKALPSRAEAARTRVPGGYVLEARLPWAALNIKPEENVTFAFQVWVNDADTGDGPPSYRAVWYPGVGTGNNSRMSHRCRLARRSSTPMLVKAVAELDLELMEIRVEAVGPAEHAGRNVMIKEGGQTRAEAELVVDGSGRAVLSKRLPLPPLDRPYGTLSLEIDGRVADRVTLPNLDRKCAEKFLFETPVAESCIFSGDDFPVIHLQRPLWLEHLIGPFETQVTYYDSHYSVVKVAKEPGRYAAVFEITMGDGRTYRRFLTLYRTAREIHWWKEDLDVQLRLPSGLGISNRSEEQHRKTLSDFVKWQVVKQFGRSSDAAVLAAGLADSSGAAGEHPFFDDPWQRDRQWWVGLKRTLYGWDKQWAEPFVCPRPVESNPAPVVREGSPTAAGMKPDAAAQIDAVLNQWTADTDEEFAVCVVRHGVVVLHKAYGFRDGEPMTVWKPSRMASLTKMMGGSLMLMFVDQGLVDLDEPVETYLPPLRGLALNKPLTVRHLYTHTSGLEWHWGAEASDMEERIAALLPHVQVGEKFAYNGTGFDLGSKIMEAVSGESLPNLYRRHLLGPLGCVHTTIPDSGGGARSVPLDMARFGQMLLNRGSYGRMRFMGENTFEQLLPRRLTKVLGPETDEEYGLGTTWFNDPGLGDGTFAHGAASSAMVRIDPVNDFVIVMTRNTAGKNFEKYRQRFIDAIVAGMIDQKENETNRAESPL